MTPTRSAIYQEEVTHHLLQGVKSIAPTVKDPPQLLYTVSVRRVAGSYNKRATQLHRAFQIYSLLKHSVLLSHHYDGILGMHQSCQRSHLKKRQNLRHRHQKGVTIILREMKSDLLPVL